MRFTDGGIMMTVPPSIALDLSSLEWVRFLLSLTFRSGYRNYAFTILQHKRIVKGFFGSI